MSSSQPPTRLGPDLFRSLFDRIYVINLPDRTDRRREMLAELRRIGMEGDPVVEFFPAVRPADKGEFGSRGERGCFLSHLGVMKDAVAKGHRSILILEDDVGWTRAALARMARLDALRTTDWAFLHGGQGHDRPASDGAIRLERLDPERELLLGHFIGLRGEAIGQLVAYLEAMLGRPNGSPEGGPMHVDGAYSWFRRAHPDVAAYVCVPSVARQRSSRSDISVPRGWRATKAADLARRFARAIRALSPRG